MHGLQPAARKFLPTHPFPTLTLQGSEYCENKKPPLRPRACKTSHLTGDIRSPHSRALEEGAGFPPRGLRWGPGGLCLSNGRVPAGVHYQVEVT